MASDDRWTVEQVEASLGEPLREEVVVSASEWTGLLLTALDALKAQPRWVAVEERLPGRESIVCVLTDAGERVSAYFDEIDGGEVWATIPLKGEITHWLPLPPLPEEDA